MFNLMEIDGTQIAIIIITANIIRQWKAIIMAIITLINNK
jgi:hypothetical protein